jgi:hypothetical protein
MANKPDDWTKELEADLATLASCIWATQQRLAEKGLTIDGGETRPFGCARVIDFGKHLVSSDRHDLACGHRRTAEPWRGMLRDGAFAPVAPMAGQTRRIGSRAANVPTASDSTWRRWSGRGVETSRCRDWKAVCVARGADRDRDRSRAKLLCGLAIRAGQPATRRCRTRQRIHRATYHCRT